MHKHIYIYVKEEEDEEEEEEEEAQFGKNAGELPGQKATGTWQQKWRINIKI